MKKGFYSTSALIIIFSLFQCLKGDGSCGDWVSYKDEKCYKLLDNVETHDGAIELCKKQISTATLASILSPEEQEFLENYIFKKRGALNSVWIGARRNPQNNATFIWDDGNRFDRYSNWDKDDKHNPGDDCAEMQPLIPYYADNSKLGKWQDVQCTGNKRNQVLCQTGQSWTLDKLVKTFLEFRRDFVDLSALTNKNQQNNVNSIQNLGNELNKLKDSDAKSIASLNTDITNAKKSIDDINGKTNNLISNPVPLNFIYIQLPSQPEPSALWPNVQWEDVSATYAGLFFRVLGGTSEKFGTVQNENSPRLASVEMIETPKAAARPVKLDIPPNGDFSAQMYVASGPAPAAQALDNHLRFKLSPGEVRPRNHAVRVWKRTK